MDIEKQKEAYIARAVNIELGLIDELPDSDYSDRIQFWQGLSNTDRMSATTEIVRRVHLAKGGSLNELKVNKNLVRIVRH
ncbi:MAG: hypothetical protein ABL952_15045 [Pyrinomonadaceae bacterium]